MTQLENVTIVNYAYLIAVPYGMEIDEAWERIQNAKDMGVRPWPKSTLIKYHCHVITRPSGRVVGVQPA